MKLRLSLSLRRCLLACYAAAVATLGSFGAYAGTLHEDVSMQTYTDFGQNMGRYVTGGHVNALLSHIRSQEGITITYTGGEADYVLTLPMPAFESQADNGASAAIGYNFLATVQHNGVQNPTFTSTVLPKGTSVQYSGIEYRVSDKFLLTPSVDYKITRLSKLVTDVETSALYTGTPQVGDMVYRAGAGYMTMRDKDGNIHVLHGAYDYITGGITTLTGAHPDGSGAEGDDSTRTSFSFDYTEKGINAATPLPFNADSGDSGSPVWIWNAETNRFEYLTSAQSVNATDGAGVNTYCFGAPQWSQNTMDAYSKQVDVASTADGYVYVSGDMVQGESWTEDVYKELPDKTTVFDYTRVGEQWSADVIDSQGRVLATFNGVKNGVSTWNSLTELKDTDNWYAYGAQYLNANERGNDGKGLTIATLFRTENLVFRSDKAQNVVEIDDRGVDLGVGYAQFSRTGGSPVSYTVSGGAFNHAGYIVDEGVSVHLTSANTDDANMREWRKVGAGDLYIEGAGSNEVFLNLGGSGTTYLNENDGYAAYNVLANTGTRVVLSDVNQIARDFTFGNGGAVLDFNGHSMTWNNGADVAADGFSIHALTEEAVITNSGADAVTLRVTNGGSEFLGSFRDTEDSQLNIVYAGAGNWDLHSIRTDLSHSNGLTVESGSVTLSGTQTVHGMGSVDGRTNQRLQRENDWHYADAAMAVDVKRGATFTLGSHARLDGNVTVAQDGLFVMKETVQHQMEYVEGGSRLENTDKYAAYMGLKGDVTLNGGAMRVEFSEGTDAITTYGGSISGTGDLTIATGQGTLKLTGDNSLFSGLKRVENGTVAFGTLASMGDTAEHKWYVAADSVLVMPQTEDFSGIDTASEGVVALAYNTLTQAPLSLHIGAADGFAVHYGESGTELTPNGGSWTLGGGGGELVVDFLLSGDNQLVVGNGHTTGVVRLTNTDNTFSGGIVMNKGMRLEYDDARALGNSSVLVSYGASVASHGDVAHFDSRSDGALLADDAVNRDIDLSGTPSLSLAADGRVIYTGNLTVADGAAYRFGGASGILVLSTAIEGAHDVVLDSQGSTGGVVVFDRTTSVSGAITMQGYDGTHADSGNLRVAFNMSHSFDMATSVTLRNNTTVDLNGTTQVFNRLTLDETSSIIDASADRRGELGLLASSDSTLNGNVNVGSITLSNSATFTIGNLVHADTLVKTGSGSMVLVNAQNFETVKVLGGELRFNQSNANFNTVILRNASINASNPGMYDVSLNGHLVLGENATVYVSPKNEGLRGTLTVEEGANATIAHAYSGNTNVYSTISIGKGGVLNLAAADNSALVLHSTDINADGQGAINLWNKALYLGSMAADATQRIGGEFRVVNNATVYAVGNTSGVTRSFEHVSVGAGKTLSLQTGNADVSTTWQMDSVTGDGAVQLDNRSGSKLVLTGESSVSSISGSTALVLQGADVSSSLSGGMRVESYGDSTLSGNNSYTGSTYVKGGTLTAAGEHSLGSGAVVMENGTLLLGGDAAVQSLRGAAGAVQLQGHKLSLSGSGDAGYAGAVSGGSLAVLGTGQTLSGAVELQQLQLGSNAALNVTNGAVIGNGGVSLGSGAHLSLNGKTELHAGITAAQDALLSLGDGISISLDYADFDSNGQFTVFSGSGSHDGTVLTSSNILVDGLAGSQFGSQFSLSDSGNAITVTMSDYGHQLTWLNGQQTWNTTTKAWTDAAGNAAVFHNGDRVTFNGSGGWVDVAAGLRAGSVDVTCTSRYVAFTFRENTLSVAHDFVVESGNVSFTTGDVSIGGVMRVKDGATVTYDGGTHALDYGVVVEGSGKFVVSNSAVLTVTTDSHIGAMEVVNGSSSLNGKAYVDNLSVQKWSANASLYANSLVVNGVVFRGGHFATTTGDLNINSVENAAVISGSGTVSAETVEVQAGSALNLNSNNLNLTLTGGLTNRGELIVDKAATISGDTFDTEGGTITANANLNLTAYKFFAGGNNRTDINKLFAAASGGTGTITIGTGDAWQFMSGDATIAAHFNIVGERLQLNAGQSKDATWHLTDGGSLTMKGSLEFQNTARLSVEGGELNADNIVLGHKDGNYAGHLSLSGGAVTTKGVGLLHGGNTFDMSGGKLTITGDKLFTGTGTASLSVSGGTLAATESSWELNHDVRLGEVTVETTADTAISMTGKTELTATLLNKGNLSIAMEEQQEGEEVERLLFATGEDWEVSHRYYDSVSGSTVNGFADSRYMLIKGESGSHLDLNGRTIIAVNGTDYSLRTDGESAWFTDGTYDTREYVVNAGILNFGAEDNAAASANSIRLNGGDLSLQAALGGRAVAVDRNAVITIGSGITLSDSALTVASAARVTLAGDGLYDLAAGSIDFADGVFAGEDWNGSVRVNHYSGNELQNDLNALDAAAKVVILNDVSGYLSGDVTANLEMAVAAANQAALRITNGYAGKRNTFKGSMSGAGTFQHDWTPRKGSPDVYVFEGDIEEWTGTIANAKGDMRVVLAGYNDDVYTAFADAAAGLFLDLGDEAAPLMADNFTFHNTVEAFELNTNAMQTVTFEKAAELANLNTKAALQLNSTDAAGVTVTDTLTLGGLLTHSGALHLQNIALKDGDASWVRTTGYVDPVSGVGENGFLRNTLIQGTEGSSVSLSPTASIALNGLNYALRTENGSVWYGDAMHIGSQLYTKVYTVNSGTLVFGDAGNGAATADALLLNGGNLSLQQTLGARPIAVEKNAAITIGSGVALKAGSLYQKDGTAVTLSGQGEYQLASGETTMTSGVALAPAWQGTVRISDYGNRNINVTTAINNMGDRGTKVGLTGVKGYITQNGSVSANLDLKDNGETVAFEILNGYANSNNTFAGSISGDGTLRHNWKPNGADKYAFTGDVSSWTGVLDNAAGQLGVTFSGNATTINAEIRTATATDAEASTALSTSANATTFNKGVHATTLTTGGAVTFNGAVTIDGATTLGGLVTNNAHLTLNRGINVSGNWVEYTTAYDAVSGDTRNGFSRGYLILGGEGASLNLGSQSTVSICGQNYDLHTGNGSAWVGGNDYAVNTQVEFGSGDNDTLSATSLTLNNGAELVLAANLGERTVNVAANAATTVNIAEKVQMKASSLTIGQGGSVSLTGSGTYALATGGRELGSGVSLAEDWTGAVRVHATGTVGKIGADDGLSFMTSGQHSLVNGDKSVVQVAGISGWMSVPASSVLYDANIDLDNGVNGYALKITADSGNRHYHFSGNLSGSGSWVLGEGMTVGNNTYYIEGDASAWNGTFESAAGKGNNLVFAHDDAQINAAVKQTGTGSLNITASKSTTFNNTVDTKGAFTANADVAFNKNSSVGTLAENGHAVSLGKNTDLTLSQTIAGHATDGGNTDSAASVDLRVNGDAGSSLHLTMNTNTGWQQNNTIRVQAEAGKESVRDIYVSGAMAYDVFNGTAQTNLGSSNLHLADKTVLEIRKDQSENGINITSGDIVLAGTTEVNLYGNASADAKMSSAIRTEEGQESTLKLTGGGGITLANSVKVDTLQVSASNGVGLTDTVTIAGAYTVSGTETQKAELKNTKLSAESISGGISGGTITNSLIDLNKALRVQLEDVTLTGCQTEMKAVIGENATMGATPSESTVAMVLTNTADSTIQQTLAKGETVQSMTLGNFSNATLNGGSLTISLDASVIGYEPEYDWLAISLDSPAAAMGIMTLAAADADTGAALNGVQVMLDLYNAENPSIVNTLIGYMSNTSQNIVYFNMEEVPEPATATLSLLALAALCARRRR